MILLHKTAPLVLAAFGPLAVELSREANELQMWGSRGEHVPRVIEADNARNVGLPIRDWNGEMYTRIRMLHTVKAVKKEAGANIRFL